MNVIGLGGNPTSGLCLLTDWLLLPTISVRQDHLSGGEDGGKTPSYIFICVCTRYGAMAAGSRKNSEVTAKLQLQCAVTNAVAVTVPWPAWRGYFRADLRYGSGGVIADLDKQLQNEWILRL